MYCKQCGQPSGVPICPECEVDYEEEYDMTLDELRQHDADMKDYFADLEIRRQKEQADLQKAVCATHWHRVLSLD